MAMDVGGAKGGLKADINVTPLVDVMLVLLIIMMLIAPMLQQGVAVTLPEAGNTEPKPDTQDQTVVAIDSANQFWVNGLQFSKGDFAARVKAALEDKKEKVVLIRGDKDAKYSAIMQAMDDLRAVGIEDIYVAQSARRKGVGRAIMADLAATALARGWRRINFRVLTWNPAREVYHALGFAHIDEWLPYRIEGDGLRKLARG